MVSSLAASGTRWWWLAVSVSLVSATAPNTVMGQCAACGNPAFSVGDSALGLSLGDAPQDGFQFQFGTTYAWQQFRDLYSGSRLLGPSEKNGVVFSPDWALDIHLLAVVAAVRAPTGTELGVTLPFGLASATRAADSTTGANGQTDQLGQPLVTSVDSGLSDMELRLRQRLDSWWSADVRRRLTLAVTTGVVAPTGKFLVKGESLATEGQYTSLGRGSWWWLGEVDAAGEAFRLTNRSVGWQLGVAARLPLTEIANNNGYLFRWGPEVQTSAGLRAEVWPKHVTASASLQWQWRDSGQERVFADTPLADFANGGGHWLYLQPALVGVLGRSWALQAAVRLPLWREVGGFQPVPATGFSVGIQWQGGGVSPASTMASAARDHSRDLHDPLLQALVVPNKVTLVYWSATWCKACQVLSPQLQAYADTEPAIALSKVDVTGWEDEQMGRYLGDAPELPVLDLYDVSGKWRLRLTGSKAQDFASAANALIPREADP